MFCTFIKEYCIFRSEILLTSLILFAEKKYLGSHRALGEYSKSLKVTKNEIMRCNDLNMLRIWYKWQDFGCFALSLQSTIFSELKFFWQVSDSLPRKFIRDPAEHLVLVLNHWTSNNHTTIHKTTIIWLYIAPKPRFWDFHFWCRVVIFPELQKI